MRKLLSLTVAASAVVGAALAATTVADAAETAVRGKRAAVGDSRHPCRALALRFDNTAARMLGGNMAAGSTDMGRVPMTTGAAVPADPENNRNMAAGAGAPGGMMLDKAATTRNEGMEACNAGRIEEGMRKLNEAIMGLGT